jgi:hypothetical protein
MGLSLRKVDCASRPFAAASRLDSGCLRFSQFALASRQKLNDLTGAFLAVPARREVPKGRPATRFEFCTRQLDGARHTSTSALTG